MTDSHDLPNRRILVIDDNEAIHADFRKILGAKLDSEFEAAEARFFGETLSEPISNGFEIQAALQGREGVALVRQAIAAGQPYALAFVDVRMPPGWDGIQTTAELWKVDPDLQVVICTAYSDYSLDEMVEKLGVRDRLLILKKPFDNIEVLQLANALSEKWRLLQQSKHRLDDLEATVHQRTEELQRANQKLQAENLERTEAAEALRTTQERLEHLLRKSPVVLYSLQVAGQKLIPNWVSENSVRVLGSAPSEWKMPDWHQHHVAAEELPAFLASESEILARGSRSLEYRVRDSKGGYRWIRDECNLLRDASGAPVEVVGAYTDITERRQLEEQLRQCQKMEALGQLAGGVAHDFNNLLTVISSCGNLLLEASDFPPGRAGELKQILESADRAASLTRQLLTYGRRQVMRPQELDFSDVTRNLARMLGRLVGEDIDLEVECLPAPLLVRADRTMIEQVVLNLAANARDAMPHGGKLALRLERRELPVPELPKRANLRAGSFACLTVQDTGSGIPPEILPRIFEPFFTTKDPGKGTGLGLATCYSIVQLHQGWISVKSEPGQGATFQILLPTVERSTAKIDSKPRTQSQAPGGHETLLFVEDEDALRRVGRKVLELRGYRVLEASSGSEALDVWKEHAPEIGLLVTDLVMPDGISGFELASRVLAERPALKTLFTSGYSPELLKENGLAAAEICFLSKPYTPQTLLEAVRNALDGVASRSAHIPANQQYAATQK